MKTGSRSHIFLLAAIVLLVSNCEHRSHFYRMQYKGGGKMRSMYSPSFSSGNVPAAVVYYPTEHSGSESYAHFEENKFVSVASEEFSTFGVDVDRASYSNVRRMIMAGNLPPANAVRIEEMINYFHYDYPAPQGKDPVSIVTELSTCPWNEGHQLLMIGLQAKKLAPSAMPSSNFVFLIDVSGSMTEELPMVKSSMKLLAQQLRAEDRVSIVVYAGAAGCVLDVTPGSEKKKINEAIDKLTSGGSTAGGAGIKLAYAKAREHFIQGGNNRVVLITDGDFNVGVATVEELQSLVETERTSGVFLTCLGTGIGNYQDSRLEILADKGNGNYSYLDSEKEAKKVLLKEFGGTMYTVAKDVKLQVQFNPKNVQGYRLIGYENRMLKKEDFENDKKDAGDMGSDHSVTAIYEIIPAGVTSKYEIDEQGRKHRVDFTREAFNPVDLGVVKLRYKQPDDSASAEMKQAINKVPNKFTAASANLRFASAVALGGMVIKNSKFKGAGTMEFVIETSKELDKNDDEKDEFTGLMRKFVKLREREKERQKEMEAQTRGKL